MRVCFPLLIQGSPKPLEYTVCPLFWPSLWEERSPLLQRVLARAQARLRSQLEGCKGEGRLDQLRDLLYSPDIREQLVEFTTLHRKKTLRCRLLVILVQDLAFCPQLELWFRLSPEALGAQLEAIVKQWIRDRETQGEEVPLEQFFVPAKTWVQNLEFELPAPGAYRPSPAPTGFALLGAPAELSGAKELRRVGRNLDHYRDATEVCLGRTAELEHLKVLLAPEPRKAVVLVGPRSVGKSSLVRALVRQNPAPGKGKRQGNFWLLSPGRLIAGMSFVGQWESRLVAILKHARGYNHVLVFDDLLGLLTAGISRDSNLSVAQVLKSYLDRADVRVLAEMTPEAYQILRQRDRAFADLFQVVQVRPSDARTTLSVALATARQVEESQQCAIGLEAVRAVLQISRRYLNNAANPGRVAMPLQQLGSRFRLQEVGRQQVLEWFSQRSGLSLQLLDERIQLPRTELRAKLEELILGQPQAVDACLDVVAIAKTRLREAGRPLGAMLFVGPTGVGKTECAKALADVLFGSADRLLRFDMNEYIGDDSLARLVGAWGGSPGQLTQAIRQQPFAVVLLDEIEKAHPAVLQLLLQLLGDARLSDARGETSDFSQAIILLTSNLGASELQKSVGIRKQTDAMEQTYLRAVRDFFSPELFNRLDRVVPFQTLQRKAVAVLAHRQLDKVLKRDGLSRRQCILQVSPAALESITDAGFHPKLGARAMKRSVEESVAAPVSAQLAGLPPDAPTLIRIDEQGGHLQVTVERLLVAPFRSHRMPGLGALQKLWGRWRKEVAPAAPDGQISQEEIQEDQLFYYEMHDGLRRLRAAIENFEAPLPRIPKHPFMWPFPQEVIARVALSPDLRSALKELRSQFATEREQQLLARQWSLRARAAWMQLRLREAKQSQGILAPRGSKPFCRGLLTHYQVALSKLDFEVVLKGDQLQVSGVGAQTLLQAEHGFHLFLQPDRLEVVQIGESTEILRIYGKDVLDLRTGAMGGGDALLLMMLAALELEV